jgi:hypothetical protein
MRRRRGWRASTSALAISLALGVLYMPAPSHAETEGSQRRQDRREDRQGARDTRQTGRDEARDTKQACKGDESRAGISEARDQTDAQARASSRTTEVRASKVATRPAAGAGSRKRLRRCVDAQVQVRSAPHQARTRHGSDRSRDATLLADSTRKSKRIGRRAAGRQHPLLRPPPRVGAHGSTRRRARAIGALLADAASRRAQASCASRCPRISAV